MNEIYIDQVKKIAPGKWEELTDQQLVVWMKICSKNIDPEIALKLVSMLFYRIKKNTFFKLNAAQQVQLVNTLKFLLENKLNAWLIPVIKVRLTTFIGPSDWMSTSSIKEFSTAEAYYHAYLRLKNETLLDQLIATLYRPASTVNNGKDQRCLFTEVGIQQNAPKMKSLDKYLRAAILFNYEGCRSSVMNRYPTIFIKGEGEQSGTLPNLSPIIKTIAGGKFGTFKETEQTDLYVFLDHWRDEKEASERSKP